MKGSTPGGSCNAEKSPPTRLGPGTKRPGGSGRPGNFAFFFIGSSLWSGLIHDRSWTGSRPFFWALVAWLLMALRCCLSGVFSAVLTTK